MRARNRLGLGDPYPPICVFRGGDRLTAVAVQIGLICIRQHAWRTWLRAIGGWHSAFIGRQAQAVDGTGVGVVAWEPCLASPLRISSGVSGRRSPHARAGTGLLTCSRPVAFLGSG